MEQILIPPSDKFWIAFNDKSEYIKSLLFKKNKADYENACSIVSEIKKKFNLDMIEIYFGIGIRNGQPLQERNLYIEMIISPMFQKKYCPTINQLYSSHKKYINKCWSVIKYTYCQHDLIDTIKLTYSDIHKEIVVDKSDFSFHPILSGNTELNLLLFIKDEKSEYLIEKQDVTIHDKPRNIWIPKGSGLYNILNAAIGEYYLVSAIDKMEIYLESEHTKLTKYPISELKSHISKLQIDQENKCTRCAYSSNNVNLEIYDADTKLYYCDSICKSL